MGKTYLFILQKMPTKYKLYYYSGKGRGEPVRMIFAMAGVEYEDIRFEHDEWLEKYKASMCQNTWVDLGMTSKVSVNSLVN